MPLNALFFVLFVFAFLEDTTGGKKKNERQSKGLQTAGIPCNKLMQRDNEYNQNYIRKPKYEQN